MGFWNVYDLKCLGAAMHHDSDCAHYDCLIVERERAGLDIRSVAAQGRPRLARVEAALQI